MISDETVSAFFKIACRALQELDIELRAGLEAGGERFPDLVHGSRWLSEELLVFEIFRASLRNGFAQQHEVSLRLEWQYPRRRSDQRREHADLAFVTVENRTPRVQACIEAKGCADWTINHHRDWFLDQVPKDIDRIVDCLGDSEERGFILAIVWNTGDHADRDCPVHRNLKDRGGDQWNRIVWTAAHPQWHDSFLSRREQGECQVCVTLLEVRRGAGEGMSSA